MTLAELEHTTVDMFTTVFIGNSATHQVRGWMVTPRGYHGVWDRCVQRHYRRTGFLPRRCRVGRCRYRQRSNRLGG